MNNNSRKKTHVSVDVLLFSNPMIDISHNQLALMAKVCIVGPCPLQLRPQSVHLQYTRQKLQCLSQRHTTI